MGKRQSKLSQEQLRELTQITHFSPKELTRWYRGFLNDCPSGTINREEFCKIYHQFFPFGDPNKFASYIFNCFDVNKDGLVEFREFVRALSVTSRGTMEEKLEWSFHLYDSDHDGYITRKEVEAIVESMHKMVGQMVELSEDDETPQARVDKIFETMDLDKDGRISLQEFLDGAKADSTITKALTVYNGLL